MFRFVRVLSLWNIYVIFVEIFWLFEKYDFKLYGFFVEAIKKQIYCYLIVKII